MRRIRPPHRSLLSALVFLVIAAGAAHAQTRLTGPGTEIISGFAYGQKTQANYHSPHAIIDDEPFLSSRSSSVYLFYHGGVFDDRCRDGDPTRLYVTDPDQILTKLAFVPGVLTWHSDMEVSPCTHRGGTNVDEFGDQLAYCNVYSEESHAQDPTCPMSVTQANPNDNQIGTSWMNGQPQALPANWVLGPEKMLIMTRAWNSSKPPTKWNNASYMFLSNTWRAIDGRWTHKIWPIFVVGNSVKADLSFWQNATTVVNQTNTSVTYAVFYTFANGTLGPNTDKTVALAHVTYSPNDDFLSGNPSVKYPIETKFLVAPNVWRVVRPNDAQCPGNLGAPCLDFAPADLFKMWSIKRGYNNALELGIAHSIVKIGTKKYLAYRGYANLSALSGYVSTGPPSYCSTPTDSSYASNVGDQVDFVKLRRVWDDGTVSATDWGWLDMDGRTRDGDTILSYKPFSSHGASFVRWNNQDYVYTTSKDSWVCAAWYHDYDVRLLAAPVSLGFPQH